MHLFKTVLCYLVETKRDVKASGPVAVWPRVQQTSSQSFTSLALLAVYLSGWWTQMAP